MKNDDKENNIKPFSINIISEKKYQINKKNMKLNAIKKSKNFLINNNI